MCVAFEHVHNIAEIHENLANTDLLQTNCRTHPRDEDDDGPRFRFIDGRRYHNITNSEYPGANDDQEAVRLIRYHEAMKDIWEGLFHSPVEEKLKQGARVIDVG
ncbi:8633_t:CDS:2 [Ambispora leptoticha]|uniref:8633_t:CDS:1 n=1 Tax=Ambispora leptoticha TaxID=144679 RepID=A0A9N9DUT0_9GLOM|nr:8633_t:CDS:2 [Ambispora leptoticha]